MAAFAQLISDDEIPSAVRVEWFDDDGGCELAIFDGPRARQRAAAFAASFYGRHDDPEGLALSSLP
jgi:hypothetical protein